MLRRWAPASEKPIWMPGSRASLFSTAGRWLEIVVRQRNALPCSSTRSKNASTGCSPPRSRPTSPNDLPTTDLGAVDDFGVEEVAVPHPHTELALVLLTELTAIRLVAQEFVAPARHAGAVPRRPH